MQELLAFLRAKGFDCNPGLDGTVHRFDRNNKILNGWCIAREFESGGKNYIFASFGDWATGEKYEFSSTDGVELTPEEAHQAELARKEHQKFLENKKQEEQSSAAARALGVMALAEGYTQKETPYEKRKGITQRAHGVCNMEDTLVIPIFNQGKISSVQFIEGTQKRFLSGGKLKGSYFFIPGITHAHQEKELYLTEGYATGMSVHLATGCTVYVCFNAQNLEQVAKQLATEVKGREFVIAADNDQWTEGNPGVKHARNAAAILQGSGLAARVAYPDFENSQENKQNKLTDWNDWASIHGLESVAHSLTLPSPGVMPPPAGTLPTASTDQEATSRAPGAGVLPDIQDFNKLQVIFSKAGVPQKPPQNLVVAELDRGFGNLLMREGREVFFWRGTHWEEQNPVEFKFHVMNIAMYIRSGLASKSELEDIHMLFVAQLPSCAPHSFYQQLPTVCNFQDGTLEVYREGREFKTRFREHRREDFITWVLPYNYNMPRTGNKKFAEWLDRCFEGDPDKEGKIRALKQIGGACLISMFPRLAFLYGPSKTGKSTFAKLCMAFVGKDNYSTTLPEKMGGTFGLSPMVNKRINVCTDLSDSKLDKGLLKRWEDTLEQQVNRKHRDEIKCRLPNLHIYCTNEFPQGIDGSSGAMDERVTIVEFAKPVVTEKRVRDFEQELLEAGPGVILEFFEQGLNDLCQSGGFFFNPETGKRHLEEWKSANNLVSQFIKAVGAGDIGDKNCRIALGPDLRMRQKDVFAAYVEFAKNETRATETRVKIYKEMRQLGFRTVTIDGFEYFSGIGVPGSAESGVPMC